MTARDLRARNHALRDVLRQGVEQARRDSKRQMYRTRTRIYEDTDRTIQTIDDVDAPLAYSDWNLVVLSEPLLDAGAWDIHARIRFLFYNNLVDALWTGREKVFAYLSATPPELFDIEETGIDEDVASISSTPETAHLGGFGTITLHLFGTVSLSEASALLLRVAAVDPEPVGTHSLIVDSKIMAQPA